MAGACLAVVIPCFRVKNQILAVIEAIQDDVAFIFVVDDECPDRTGDYVEACCSDKRVVVLRHPANQGVGGAVMTGYKAAMKAGADIIVKIDGDGQMDPRLIPSSNQSSKAKLITPREIASSSSMNCGRCRRYDF